MPAKSVVSACPSARRRYLDAAMAALHERSDFLHLIDLDEEIDPLAALVVDGRAAVLKGHFEHPALRWRAAAQLFRDPPSFVIAWGERAFAVARQGGVSGIYRPARGTRLQGPAPGWRAMPSTRVELGRLIECGWKQPDCLLVSPPGTDALPRCGGGTMTRRELGAARDDFLWLLSGDAGPGSGLSEAVWAGAIMHVMERDRRMHRILLWGGSRAQHRARHFADQLGLAALPIRAGSCGFDGLAQLADAALLLPRDHAVWSAAVVAHLGLPAVINANPPVQEVLAGRSNVRTSEGERTRLIVREMLALVESGAERAAGDESFAPDRVRRQWNEAISYALSAATGAQTLPALR